MPEMKWTKEKPTAPGWYWLYDGNPVGIEVVCITTYAGNLKIWRTSIDDCSFFSDFPNSQWQGPLEVPEPPS